MLNVATLAAQAFGNHLGETYRHDFGGRGRGRRRLCDAGARLVVERIAWSDGPLPQLRAHDPGHLGRAGDHPPASCSSSRWSRRTGLHFIYALLCHDIGFVRGACAGDDADGVVIDEAGGRMEWPRGASDAVLAPYHVTRGKIAVRERFAGHRSLDSERIARAIELTRFPVPGDDDHKETATEAGLVRAADLIGQLSDPNYLSKLNALFHELKETGAAAAMGVESPADLLDCYPTFFWNAVEPFIGDGLRYLTMTVEGKRWIASLYGNVTMAEHHRVGPGDTSNWA